MQIASLPPHGDSEYAGPRVTFWDSDRGAVVCGGGSFTRDEFRQVIAQFNECEANDWDKPEPNQPVGAMDARF